MTGPPIGGVQVIPTGLTGLFGIKQMGRMPDALLSDISPSLEVRDWYFQSRRERTLSLFASIPQTAVGIVTGNRGFFGMGIGGVSSPVPAGQAWFVEQYTVFASITAAADTISFAAAIQQPSPGSSENTVVGSTYSDVVTANSRWGTSIALRGFWMLPGDTFGVWVYNVTTGTSIVPTMTLSATRLPL